MWQKSAGKKTRNESTLLQILQKLSTQIDLFSILFGHLNKHASLFNDDDDDDDDDDVDDGNGGGGDDDDDDDDYYNNRQSDKKGHVIFKTPCFTVE